MTNKRLYHEHPVFDDYTEFDPTTGVLTPIDRSSFLEAITTGMATLAGTEPWIERFDGPGRIVFDGTVFPTHTRFPRRIYFQITRHCNLECPYCFLHAGRDQPHAPTGPILELARYLGHNGLMEARLTGGEPTTHPDFLAILDAFQQSGVYVSVATNGLMSARMLHELAERPSLWVICSIDGGREVHDRFRPGTYDRIVRNLRTLKRANPGLRLRLTTVLTRANCGSIPELGELVRTLEAESITVIPLRPQVRSRAMLDQMLNAKEFGQAVEQLAETGERFGIKVTTTIETLFSSRIWRDPVVRKRFACAAGREATNLDFDERSGYFFVYGCSYSPATDLDAPEPIRHAFVAGQFAADSVWDFGRIWSDESRWTIYRGAEFKAEECLTCSYFLDNRCVGSCPIQNIDCSRVAASADVLTQLGEQIRKTSEWYCYKRVLPS